MISTVLSPLFIARHTDVSEAPSTVISEHSRFLNTANESFTSIRTFTDIFQNEHLNVCFVHLQKWAWVFNKHQILKLLNFDILNNLRLD